MIFRAAEAALPVTVRIQEGMVWTWLHGPFIVQ